MNRQLLKGLAPVTLLALLAMGAAAEAGDVRAAIPFDFVLHGKPLPRGTYTVSEAHGLLAVWNAATSGTGAFVQTIGLHSVQHRTPRLVFHRYGDQYYLREVWTGSSGREVLVRREERELARAAKAGRTAATFERVVIPAL